MYKCPNDCDSSFFRDGIESYSCRVYFNDDEDDVEVEAHGSYGEVLQEPQVYCTECESKCEEVDNV